MHIGLIRHRNIKNGVDDPYYRRLSSFHLMAEGPKMHYYWAEICAYVMHFHNPLDWSVSQCSEVETYCN